MKALTAAIMSLQAVRRGLCPRCRSGRIFSGWLCMNEECPICHLKFGREPGYFTGAMYVSYTLAVPMLIVITVILAILWHKFIPEWPLYRVFLLAAVLFLPLAPAVFRYSRIIWIHLDRYIDPAE
jgi:uncharacterized protein (DUF983 family)